MLVNLLRLMCVLTVHFQQLLQHAQRTLALLCIHVYDATWCQEYNTCMYSALPPNVMQVELPYILWHNMFISHPCNVDMLQLSVLLSGCV